MAVIDSALTLRDGSSNLTATGNTSGIGVRGVPIDDGATVEVWIPQANAADNTLTINVQESDDDSTYVTIASSPPQTWSAAQLTTGRLVTVPFNSGKKYIRVNLVFGGTAGAAGLGAVKAYITLAGRQFSRAGFLN